jgi:signal transduction histidine kinase
MHGGWIWAESKEGIGNSFCFTLPKANVQPVAASATKSAEKHHQN